MAINLKISKKLFNPVYLQHLDNTKSTQLFFGGSSSGKSYALAQRLVIDMCKGGRNYLVLRNKSADVESTVWNETKKALERFKIARYVDINKSARTMTFPNGYQVKFGGLTDKERIKGVTPPKGVITDIWLEEATEFEEDDFRQLEKRLRGKTKANKRIILSFNPIIKTHWIYTRFFGNWDESGTYYEDDRTSILKTTYRDNKFLNEDDISRITSETDPYYIDVYLNGNWGVMGSIIFKNWRVENIDYMLPRLDRTCNGLDFGFSSDPAAFVKQSFDSRSNTLYIFDEIYETGLLDQELARRIKAMAGSAEVICDSAEPKAITGLQVSGIRARGAIKGAGSLETSYRRLQGINIVVHPRCSNVKRELQTHQWRRDRTTGKDLPKPEDRNNHAIDAIRYGLNDYWQGYAPLEVW